MIRANSLVKVCKRVFGTSFISCRETSDSCLQWRNKELKRHAGEGRWAPGDRRKVPYEILKETGDGARARLPFFLSSSTSQQCACSGGELAVLPAKVSGFLCVCPSRCLYLYDWLSIYLRACLSVCVHVGLCVAQSELLHLDLTPLK